MLDWDLDAAASVKLLVVDFLEDEEKETDLLRVSVWNAFKLERPRDLLPEPITLSASASTDSYERISNRRVLGASIPRAHSVRRRLDRPWPSKRPETTAPHHAPLQGCRQASASVARARWHSPPSASSVGADGCGSSSSSYTATTVSIMSHGGKPQPAPALTNAAFPKGCRALWHPGHAQSSLRARASYRISSTVHRP
jgi:hypothetical protein